VADRIPQKTIELMNSDRPMRRRVNPRLRQPDDSLGSFRRRHA